MQRNQCGSIRRLLNACKYSAAGLKACFIHEQAFRQEVYLVLALTPVALFSAISPMEKALLLASLLQVLIVEILNSGLEALTDRISLEDHELSKRAKDLGSAAVLISLLLAVVVWLGIFFF